MMGTLIALRNMIFADNKFLKTVELRRAILCLFTVLLFKQEKKSFLIIYNSRSYLCKHRHAE
jgi:hypothetical protein